MPFPTVSTVFEFIAALVVFAFGVLFSLRMLDELRGRGDSAPRIDWGVFIVFGPLAVAFFWASGDLVVKILGWLTRTLGN
jgi:hypothetical protein